MHTDATPPLPARSRIIGFCAAIGALLLLVYGRSLLNGFVTFDDDVLVFNNPIVQSITFSHIAYVFTHFDPELYIPFTFLSYQFDWLIGDGSPIIFHSVNLLLHYMNVLLLAWFVFLLSGKKWISILCAVLFAIHPLNTEAVAWVSARKDLLSTLFFLISAISYIRYRQSASMRWYCTGLTLFAIGLLCKVMILSLPFVLILIDLLQERKWNKAVILEKLPFFALSLLLGIVAIVGKQSNVEGVPFLTYTLLIPGNIILTLQHLFFPANLSVLYPFAPSSSSWIPVALCVMLLVASIIAAWKNRIALFGLGFFAITFLPAFATFSKDGELYITSDRYAYLPMIGLLFFLGSGVNALLSRSTQTQRTVIIGIFLVITVVLGSLSYERSSVWQSTETLFADTVQKAPESSLAHNKLGSQLLDAGQTDQAEQQFRTSLQLLDNPRAHYNLGLVYLSRGDIQDAFTENQKAIALQSDYAPAHVNVGYLLWQEGKIEEAVQNFRAAIADEENNTDARIDLAVILQGQGKTEEARTLAEQVLSIDPKNTDALSLLQSLSGGSAGQ
jgi:tetratricopeptide (TPR) repeat protein